MIKKVELDFHGRPLSIEVGRLAKQADGAALGDLMARLCFGYCGGCQRVKNGHGFFPVDGRLSRENFCRRKNPWRIFQARRPAVGKRNSYLSLNRSLHSSRCLPKVCAAKLKSSPPCCPPTGKMIPTCSPCSEPLSRSMSPIFRSMARLAGVRIGRIDGKWVINPTQDRAHGKRYRYFSFRKPRRHCHGRGRRANCARGPDPRSAVCRA